MRAGMRLRADGRRSLLASLLAGGTPGAGPGQPAAAPRVTPAEVADAHQGGYPPMDPRARSSAMYALTWLLPVTLLLGGGGLLLFLWCARSGQFEDLDGAAWRILQDDARPPSGRQPRDGEG